MSDRRQVAGLMGAAITVAWIGALAPPARADDPLVVAAPAIEDRTLPWLDFRAGFGVGGSGGLRLGRGYRAAVSPGAPHRIGVTVGGVRVAARALVAEGPGLLGGPAAATLGLEFVRDWGSNRRDWVTPPYFLEELQVRVDTTACFASAGYAAWIGHGRFALEGASGLGVAQVRVVAHREVSDVFGVLVESRGAETAWLPAARAELAFGIEFGRREFGARTLFDPGRLSRSGLRIALVATWLPPLGVGSHDGTLRFGRYLGSSFTIGFSLHAVGG